MPTKTHPNLDDLLRVLTAATERSKLHWQTTADEDAFRAEFGFGMVRIEQNRTSSRYLLTLLDQEGTIVDEYRPSGEGEVIALDVLYKKVRRQALDLDSKLSDLYGHLKQLAGET